MLFKFTIIYLTGHFTQVVWKGTSEVGFGKAKDAKGLVIVVASYRPPGNIAGQFKNNVLAPKKERKQR